MGLAIYNIRLMNHRPTSQANNKLYVNLKKSDRKKI